MRKRTEAAKYFERCAPAIPAWIMPIDRVWSSIKPGMKPLFDVVIVDEASQCGVQAVLLCYLAKKVIVVGDDK
jgi:superfamily I DNA and/or RNA helicase